MQERIAKRRTKGSPAKTTSRAGKVAPTSRGATPAALDPVDYAVISQALIAIAREMGTKLIRSSYSNIVREAQDASAALFDAAGNVVAQAELIPMHLGSMSEIFRACVERCPISELRPGDFYINNDPYGGGQHLQDVFIFTPVFIDGRLVAFAGTVAHHLDLGGGNPGMTPDAVDVHAEGIIIPPSRYTYDRDWNGGPLERLIAANVRVPSQTIGDFYAQFAANAIGTARMTELCTRYGVATVSAAMDELMAYSERRFRAALAAIPDGTWLAEDSVDDDGLTDTPLTVKAAVTKRGDTISVDFAGTVPQVGRNLNCPWASTVSATLAAIKAALTSPDIPFNEGFKRPITVTAPKGCLVNPNYPAPVRARLLPAYRCFDATLKALAQVVPDNVIAGGNDATHALAISHLGPKGYRVYLEIYGGGFGGGPRLDGCDAVDSPLSNCTNTPVEATDMDFEHFRIIGYGLVPDTGGAGRHRGGLGLMRRFLILKDSNFATYTDRVRLAPYGLFGGLDGSRTRIEIERNGQIIKLKSKDRVDLRAGDILTLTSSGGGGYGAPGQRDARLVANDVAQGYVTAEAAARDYGWTAPR
ncbi:MAG: hydantoinase B/oxoprolinase family protein [Hyphomicrobiaceae bacterium]|nr:hydantoinase B/oxoprolinase family protein [Hyphomicrobiaceae bacterium]